ncbi:MAG: DUF488 family protein [Dehalococcoidia bacterium]|jgi:uncharacterized protein YeaO (DUF488 family)
MAIRIRRAYDPPAPEDGRRVLVDRLWPRGIRKDDLCVEAWLRELAPSTELRHWFAHDPSRWREFRERYQTELAGPRQQELIDELAEQASSGTVTFVYSSREERYNNAVALRELVEARMKRRSGA